MPYLVGRVYEIVGITHPEIVYVGSTFKILKKRMSQHYSDYKRIDFDKKKTLCIYKYFKKYGIENFKMRLIKKYKVCADNTRDKKHLSVYEQLWMNKKKCVNKMKSFNIEHISRKARYLKNKEKNKESRKVYYQKNRGTISVKRKVYYAKTKDKQNKDSREYRQKHKKELQIKDKEYQLKNKDKISKRKKIKVECPCGSIITKSHIRRHERSDRHKINMAEMA